MSMQAQQVVLPQIAPPSRLRRYRKNFARFLSKNPLGAIGLFMVMVVIIMGIFVPVFQRYDPIDQDYLQRLNGPSVTHFFGTDEFGRDLWARIVGGARISLLVSFSSVAMGSVLGFILGIISGYFGGIVDNIFQRLVEIKLSIPGILLALALMTAFGAGVDKVIFAIALSFVGRALRVIRGSVLSVKENVYIEAARAIGASHSRIMFRHILPNVMAPFLIIASSALGGAILQESTLSFLGLGVPPPFPSWGRMLSNSVASYALTAPWMVIFPGIAITWLVLGFNFFGDALRDIWDPRLRGSQ
ncbi:MAG: ABC transporter permease [Chloroflexi bacterium]|nr:ABC transporter permease [Chloroflexota bacterium]